MGISGHDYDAITLEEFTAPIAQPVIQYESTVPVTLSAISRLREDWMGSAACEGARSSFYPPDKGEGNVARIAREERAKEICGMCVVIDPCFSYAMETGEKGIWGGTTERERRRIRLYAKHSE